MFGKLLKHDFKAVFKGSLPLILAALAAAVIGGLSINFMTNANTRDNDILEALIALSTFLSYLVVISAPIGIQIIVFSHFYKNLFTDEGYLTFTLPVKRSSILLSKTLNAAIWTAISAATTFILIMVSIACTGALPAAIDIFESILSIFKFTSFTDALWIVVYAIMAVLILVALSVMQINLIQFCITLGATLVKKHKILASVGIYYAVNSALSFLAQILAIFSIEPITTWFDYISRTDQTPYPYLFAILIILLIVFIFISVIAVIFYSLSVFRIKSRFNLS